MSQAFDLAVACDAEVLIRESLTEYATQFATPRLTVREETSAPAVRTRLSGGWRPVDPTVRLNPMTGGLSVASPVFDIDLGAVAGGEFASIATADGLGVSLGLPVGLGEPSVEGAQVTWPLVGEVGPIPGADLVAWIHPDTTGLTPVVRLADPAAYAAVTAAGSGPLAFEVAASDGLSLVEVPGGSGFEAVDASGRAVFASPQALQWDSSAGVPGEPDPVTEDLLEVAGLTVGASSVQSVEPLEEVSAGEGLGGDIVPTTDRLLEPAPGDRVVPMSVEVTSDVARIAADESMLADPGTTWPVYVDPPISGSLSEWTAIRTGWPDSAAGFKFSGTQGVGLCDVHNPYGGECLRDSVQRLVWEFGGLSTLGSLAGSDVTRAVFSVYGAHSYSCTATGISVYNVPGISSSTTWNNYSSRFDDIGGAVTSATVAHKSTCNNQRWIEFDVTSAARRQADTNQTAFALGLISASESSMSAWKTYRYDARVSIEFNRPPKTPRGMQTLVGGANVGCGTLTSPSMIATRTPSISVIGEDPDGGTVSMVFRAYNSSDTTIWGPSSMPAQQASGSRFTVAIPTGVLSEGGTYRWRARTSDSAGRQSLSDVMCVFKVDTTKPTPPAITPMTSGSGVEAVYEADVETGGIGFKGCFRLSKAGGAGVTSFKYGFNVSSPTTTIPVAADGTAVVCHEPTQSGPATLRVLSLDAAGNPSTQTVHEFVVAYPVEDGIWMFDEGSGGSARDSGPVEAPALTLSGSPTWGAGPHQDFGSRGSDRALVFNGVDQFAAAPGPVVDTTKSFAVSAYVWLDPARLDQGLGYTAVAANGATHSGFQLAYRPTCTSTGGDAGKGCWAMTMLNSDGGGGGAYALSDQEVVTGQWVHLVGEHDAAEQKVRVWVCELGTPQRPGVGEPFMAEAARTVAPWPAYGQMTVGKAVYAGAWRDFWPGKVDNVRVFSGEVLAPAKIRRLCQGAEAYDFSNGLAALDPTDNTDGDQ